jgi:DNA-binding MarR family transcriptional regulator
MYIHLLYIHLNIPVMRIEEEIKQKTFKDEYHKLVINIKFTSGWLGGFHNRMLKCHGLSSQQFNVLRILKGQYPKPSSLILIKDRMLDKDSNASRLIDKLEAAGLTKRVQCPNDRRQVDITITEAGLQLLEKVNPDLDKLTSEIINLNEEDARTLNHLLDKLREGIENKDYSNLHTNIERSNS